MVAITPERTDLERQGWSFRSSPIRGGVRVYARGPSGQRANIDGESWRAAMADAASWARCVIALEAPLAEKLFDHERDMRAAT